VWRPLRPRPPNGTWPTQGVAVVAVVAAVVAGGAQLAVADGGGGAVRLRPRQPLLPLRPCFGGPDGRDAVAVGVGRTCRQCRRAQVHQALRRQALRRVAQRRYRLRPRRPHRLPHPCTVAAVAVGVYPVRRTAKPKRNAHTQTTQTF